MLQGCLSLWNAVVVAAALLPKIKMARSIEVLFMAGFLRGLLMD